jgi:hypothetical protein
MFFSSASGACEMYREWHEETQSGKCWRTYMREYVETSIARS